jgi:predicted lipoprotein with Yx(FWY)xxD motif
MRTVRRSSTLVAVAVSAVTLAAGCGSSTTKSSPSPPASSAPSPYSSSPSTPSSPSSPSTSGGAALKVGTPKFSMALTDSSGNALYLFEADTSSTSTCTGACASQWPPLLTKGAPSITGGDASKLGTTKRADGGTQVTYNGHPLYTYYHDTKPGDTNGEGSTAFGAGWYLISPTGTKIDNS